MPVVTLPQLKMCKDPACGNIATGYKGFCFNHSPVKTLGSYASCPKPRGSTKNPMGIEIECYSPDRLVRRVTHLAPYVCSDASLPPGGGEIKLCATEDKMEDKAADVIQRARIAGNAVNKRCGLHLHFQMPLNNQPAYIGRMDSRSRLFAMLINMEEFIFDIVPASRKHNGFCEKLTYAGRLHSHYSWFSLSNRHPTFEIRIHASTLNPWKIKGWINAWKQVRPDIHKVYLGADGWEDIVVSYQKDGFLRRLDPTSIGYKYIKARADNGGTLKNFGFSSAS